MNRSSEYLEHRLAARDYVRYGDDRNGKLSAYVVTRVARKHGGTIGYVMEAMGRELPKLIRGALHGMYEEGAEVALAWCAPWSANYGAYLRAGFVPLPDRLRPIQLHFGARVLAAAGPGGRARDWYVSYLDSDTV